uniref:Uncharacterized protein n=1 Tax=Cucumis melo TaxID=3656 RepID=A0A9I9EJS3_CUCME
ASLLSIEISGENLPPSVEAATVTLVLFQASEVLTAIVASPQTQPLPSRSLIRMELVAPSILLRSRLLHQ